MSQPHTPISTPWEVDHIGIAVTDLASAISLYSQCAHTSVTLTERIEQQGVELAFLDTGGSKIELLAPINDTSTLAKFIARRGTGLHHICYRVKDINAELARLAAQGLELIDHTPRHGAGGTKIAFISPKSCFGVLTELCEYPPV
ncbi:MAG: methylmalonyl-CoA epimerase [Pseudomonadota bacterium]|jgi:methylmalonyl-CoA epimerase